MAKRTRIEPALFQCPRCKKKYFSYLQRMWCPECAEETKEGDKKISIKGVEIERQQPV